MLLSCNYEGRRKSVFVTTPAAFVIGIVLATSGEKVTINKEIKEAVILLKD